MSRENNLMSNSMRAKWIETKVVKKEKSEEVKN